MRYRFVSACVTFGLAGIILVSGHDRIVLSAAGKVVNGPATTQARPQESAAAQAAGLRIIVIEGEDAVNVIQQKTAAAPVVEVRDRNDQPVAGAVVRFAIRSGRATFNGAQELTVTTNAAGRAAVTGFAPTGTGALQISATAAFQGQTAVATIAQTNVLTAAQAAGVAGASGAGGGAGSGATAGAGSAAGGGGGAGGLSATTIAIVGGAAAGGTLVATQVVGNDETPGEGSPQTANVGGTWIGRAPDGWTTFDSNANCGRDVNDLVLVFSQTGSSLSGTITWTIRESFFPPDVGRTNSVGLTGSVVGDVVTFAFDRFSGSATATSTRMTGSVTEPGGPCQPMPFAVNR